MSTVVAEFNISKIFKRHFASKRHICVGNAKGHLRGSMVEQNRFSTVRWVKVFAYFSDEQKHDAKQAELFSVLSLQNPMCFGADFLVQICCVA